MGIEFISDTSIVCVKTHSVEYYDLSSCLETPGLASMLYGPVPYISTASPHRLRKGVTLLRRDLPDTTFRGVSFSAPKKSCTPEGNWTTSISFLAHDVIRGLFHYTVNIHSCLPNSSSNNVPASMDVRLVSVRRMATLITSPPESGIVFPPRSGFTQGSRGFVYACALGREGKRAIWLERQRLSVLRAVYGFVVGSSEDEQHHDGVGEDDRIISGHCLCEVNSPDLRDDITHCAFSEVTGTVVLGTRNGDVLLL